MVKLVTPRVAPVARQAGQVSRSGSQSLQRAAGVAQGVADQFSEFYEKEAAIENDLLLATAQADWAKTYNERSKGAGRGFTKGIMGDYDTYVAEVMANSPERGRDGLKLAFQKYRLNLESKSLQREAAARAAAKNAAVAETQRQLGLTIARSDTPGDAYYAILKGNPTLSERQQTSLLNTTYNAFITQGTDAAYDSAKRMIDGPYGDRLTGSEYERMERSIKSGQASLDSKRASAQKVALNSFYDQVEDQSALIADQGVSPDMGSINQQIDDLGFNEADTTAIKASAQDSFDYAGTLHTINGASSEEIDQIVSDAISSAAEPGDNIRDIKRRNAVFSAIGERNQSIKDDPAAHLISGDAPLAGMFENASAASPDVKPILYGRIKSYMDAEYDRIGVPGGMRTYLPKQAAQQIAADMNSAPGGEAGATLYQMREQYGDAAPMVIAQLREEGLTNIAYQSMRFADNMAAMSRLDLLRGTTHKELADNIGDVKKSEVTEEFNANAEQYRLAFLSGGNQDAVSVFDDIRQIVEMDAMNIVAREGLPVSQAMARSVAMFMPEKPLIGEHTRLLLPAGVEPYKFFDFKLDTLDKETGLFVNHPEVQREYSYSSIRSRGMWVNNDTGDGAFLTYMPEVGAIPVKVTLPDGTPYQVMFDDIPKAGVPSGPMGTGKTTQYGRAVWVDPTGESYSERGATIQLGNGKWVAVPSINPSTGLTISARGLEDIYSDQVSPTDPMTGETYPTFRTEEEATEWSKKRSMGIKYK